MVHLYLHSAVIEWYE